LVAAFSNSSICHPCRIAADAAIECGSSSAGPCPAGLADRVNEGTGELVPVGVWRRADLLYRELGFSLEAIATTIDDPSVDALAHLKRQRDLLIDRANRLREMVATIDRTMEAHRMV
jgi:hypothetical protein